MLHFHCPSCQTELQTLDEFAGKSIVCPTCLQAAPVPATSAVTTPDVARKAKTGPQHEEDERDHDEPQPKERSIAAPSGFAWLKISVYGTIGLSVFAVVVCLLMPVPHRVRGPSMRTQSINNLKQIALAMHGFHDFHKRLPFNGSDIAVNEMPYSAKARPGDERSGSWLFQILPFIDQQPLFAAGPAVNDGRKQGIQAYICPARGRPLVETEGGAWSDYFLNNYLNDPLQARVANAADKKRRMVSITDGISNTVFAGHGNISTDQYARDKNVTGLTNIFNGGTLGTMRAGDNGNHSPTGVTLQRDSAALPGVGSWGGPFQQGALMVMGDATVRMFPYATNNFGAFLTPTGNEGVILPD